MANADKRYRALRSGLPLLAGLLVVAGASARSSVGSWSGSYTLPLHAEPVAISFSRSGGTAVVSLGPGHAAAVQVQVIEAGGAVRFSLSGRPAALIFSGRIRDRVFAGTVRQGAAAGRFRLVAGTAQPANAALGAYRMDSGGFVVVADYRRLGLPLWAIDYRSGAFRALSPSGTGFRVGPTVLASAPPTGQILVNADKLTWTPDGGTGTRFAVRQYEVRFPSGKAVLAGTLSIPATLGVHPAAALVHGSGPANRDEGQFLAALLLEHGIAVLSYDKRGIGESTGAYPGEQATDANIDIYARDAQAAVRFLAQQPEVDPARVGLVGGSQAGWIIPLAAVRSPAVRFAIIQSGPTVTVGETADFSSFTTQGALPLTQPLSEIDAQVERDGPSGFDPKPSIRKLQIPVLWLFGGLDMNQPSNLDVRVLGQIRAETGHDYSWYLYPDGNHGIFEVQTGLNSELARSRGMPPEFFRDVAAWLQAHHLTD